MNSPIDLALGSVPPRPAPRNQLSLSVSTRSMARQASSSLSAAAASAASSRSTLPTRESNLTRPTLASARKAAPALKTSAAASFGAAAKKSAGKRVLGESTLNPSVSIYGLAKRAGGEDGAKVGWKRKADDAQGVVKKVRLHSPVTIHKPSRPLGQGLYSSQAQTPSRPKYPTTPHRVSHNVSTTPSRTHAVTTPQRKTPGLGASTAFKTPGGTFRTPGGVNKMPMTPAARANLVWKTPLAHTPSRIHDTPPQDMSGVSEDDLLMGDEPLPVVWVGDTPMRRVSGGVVVLKDGVEGQEMEDQNDTSGGGEPVGKSTKMLGGGLRRTTALSQMVGDGTEEGARTKPETADEDMEDSFGDSLDISPESASPLDSPTKIHSSPISRRSLSPPPPATVAIAPPLSPLPPASTLSVPAPTFTIAASPRKGLGGMSRFRTLDKAKTTRILDQVDGLVAPTAISHRQPPSPAKVLEPDCDAVMQEPHPPITAALSSRSADPAVSMPPPSRIPIKITKSGLPTSVSSTYLRAANNGADEKEPAALVKKPALTGLAARRPISRPTMVKSAGVGANLSAPPTRSSARQTSRGGESEEPLVRRKPSYPSSLGSGPLLKPRERMVSVPVPSHVLEPAYPDLSEYDAGSLPTKSPGLRSVSAPVPRDKDREKAALSLSTRREGWMDTSKSLHGLSEALERLKVKRENSGARPSLASSTTSRQSLSFMLNDGPKGKENDREVLTASTSMRLSAVHKSRMSLASMAGLSGATGVADGEADAADGDKSLAAIVCSTAGVGCLKGVTAFVDVWTADGTDSSGIFADMLKGLGARVLGRPTESCTHIIYKSGRPSTLAWYRKQEEDTRPHIVGISWVTRSKEAGKRLEEAKYKVDVSEEDVFSKRRKSMEPKMLSLANSLNCSVGPGSNSARMLSAGIAEMKSKSLQHAPKIASPLRKVSHRESMELQ